jgi:hypothetical protein
MAIGWDMRLQQFEKLSFNSPVSNRVSAALITRIYKGSKLLSRHKQAFASQFWRVNENKSALCAHLSPRAGEPEIHAGEHG